MSFEKKICVTKKYMLFVDSNNDSIPPPRPVSAPVISANTENANDRVKDNANEVTLSLRRPRSCGEDKGIYFCFPVEREI